MALMRRIEPIVTLPGNVPTLKTLNIRINDLERRVKDLTRRNEELTAINRGLVERMKNVELTGGGFSPN